jgi:uncharacterized protein YbjT (DUF2867 family)
MAPQPKEIVMFVIAGVSGHTGSKAAQTLLDRGEKVRVLVRDAAQGAAWKQKGADVAVVALEETSKLAAAIEAATGVYLLVPPAYGAADMLAHQRGVVESLAAAIRTARPKHVVLLSSVGAERDAGTGPIRTLHYAEAALRATGVPTTALRAAYFLENWGSVIGVAREHAVLPSMLAPGRPIAMVATADIGRVAAELLLEGPRAPEIVELSGPEDATPEDVAHAVSKALGKEVNVVPVADADIVKTLVGAGMSEGVAALFREMIDGINRGETKWQRGAARETRGRVGVAEVVRQIAQ